MGETEELLREALEAFKSIADQASWMDGGGNFMSISEEMIAKLEAALSPNPERAPLVEEEG